MKVALLVDILFLYVFAYAISISICDSAGGMLQIHNITDHDLLGDDDGDKDNTREMQPTCTVENDAALTLTALQHTQMVKQFVPKFTANAHPCGLAKGKRPLDKGVFMHHDMLCHIKFVHEQFVCGYFYVFLQNRHNITTDAGVFLDAEIEHDPEPQFELPSSPYQVPHNQTL